MNLARLALAALLAAGLAALALRPVAQARNVSTTDPRPAPAPLPDTPVGAQLAWTLVALNAGAGTLTEEELTAHFAPGFLAVLPPARLVGAFEELAAPGPFALRGVTRPPTATQATALLADAGGRPFILTAAVEATAPHRLTGLNVAPVPPPPGVDLRPFAPGAERDRSDGLIDVGGRRLYLTCRGAGGPTVVLESGMGDGAAPWFAVEGAVAGFTRVCSYDRANAVAGASDPAPTPRTGQDSAADLDALLRAAGVPGPYVLVGHSFGGHVARLYAAAHPTSVAGLVLVDPSHEGPAPLPQAPGGPEAGPAEAEEAPAPDPSDLEGIDREATAAQVRASRAATPLPGMPLVVLTAGLGFDEVPLPPGVSAEELAQLWRALGADLAALAPGGRQVIAERSGHYIHQSEPELVVDAIREVVESVRGGETGARP